MLRCQTTKTELHVFCFFMLGRFYHLKLWYLGTRNYVWNIKSTGVNLQAYNKSKETKSTTNQQMIRLMEEILHHLRWLKPYKQWDNHHPWWCRISSINSISSSAGFFPCFPFNPPVSWHSLGYRNPSPAALHQVSMNQLCSCHWNS